jgi:hypothetical protein
MRVGDFAAWRLQINYKRFNAFTIITKIREYIMDMEGEKDLLQFRDMAEACRQGRDAAWVLAEAGVCDTFEQSVKK